jgi:hypothetical protein
MTTTIECKDCSKSITKVCRRCKELDEYYDDCWECGKKTLKENLSVCDNCPTCEDDHDCDEYDR